MRRPRHYAFPCALLLAACSGAPDAKVESARQNGAVMGDDPVFRAALRDPIMVDPALMQQANADTVRPPPYPVSGAVPPDDIAARGTAFDPGRLRATPAPSSGCPQCRIVRRSLTLGALAESQGVDSRCTATIGYSTAWANRLPDAVSLYPDARVVEAAGADGNKCALRAVSFASAAPLPRMLDWYYTRATDAGYRAEHRAEGDEHLLTGRRTQGAGAFLVVLKPRPGGGTSVDLVTDGG